MQTSDRRGSLARTLLIFLGFCLIFLTVCHFSLQFINLEVYHQQHGQFYELSNRFDFDDESSIPTWFSQFIFLFIAVLSGLAAYLSTKRAVRWLWGIVGLTALFSSIDEISGLHEFALQTIHVLFYQDARPGSYSNAWLLVLPFVVATAIGFLYMMLRYLPTRTVMFFAVAIVVFLTGAVGIDVIASVSERESFLNQGIIVGLEESLETLSLIIIAYAITDYLEQIHGKNIQKALEALRD